MSDVWDGHTERREAQQTKLDVVYKINLGIILAFFVQVSGAVWWASGQTSNTHHLRMSIARIEAQLDKASANRFTSIDADRTITVLQKQIQQNTIAIQNNTASIQRFYEKMFK